MLPRSVLLGVKVTAYGIISAQFRHTFWLLFGYNTNRCSIYVEGTLDHALDGRRGARRRRLREIREQTAQLAQEVTQIVRDAEDEDDWRAAGCSSSAQWLAQIYDADYRAAERITRTSDALRELPALDEAMSNGELSLDQAARRRRGGDARDRG